MNVDVGELITEKEGAVGIGHVYDFANFVLELGGVFCLFVEILGLKELVEGWDNASIDLNWIRAICGPDRKTRT